MLIIQNTTSARAAIAQAKDKRDKLNSTLNYNENNPYAELIKAVLKIDSGVNKFVSLEQLYVNAIASELIFNDCPVIYV